MIKDDSICKKCLNSRWIISENGIHYNCILPSKEALKCAFGIEDKYIAFPNKKNRGVNND